MSRCVIFMIYDMVIKMMEFRTQIKEGGRIIIPAPLRKALHLEIGEDVLLKLEDEELHVVTLKHAVLKAQSLVEKYNKKKISLTDELFKMRQEDND